MYGCYGLDLLFERFCTCVTMLFMLGLIDLWLRNWFCACLCSYVGPHVMCEYIFGSIGIKFRNVDFWWGSRTQGEFLKIFPYLVPFPDASRHPHSIHALPSLFSYSASLLSSRQAPASIPFSLLAGETSSQWSLSILVIIQANSK